MVAGICLAIAANDGPRSGLEAVDYPAGVRVIRATDDDHRMLALAGGVLRYLPEGRCFVLDRGLTPSNAPPPSAPAGDGSYRLVVWPKGTQPTEANGVPAARIGKDIARSGDTVQLGGGNDDGRAIADLLADLVPAACPFDGVFIVGSLEAVVDR